MAVLEALYATKLLPELLSGLHQEQQLQVAMLADKWELPSISAAAAGELLQELNTAGQLSDAATEQLLTSDAVPSCLEPLLKVLLLSEFGDLEAVWADDALWQQLRGLSLPAMKLLLSSDKLNVNLKACVPESMRTLQHHQHACHAQVFSTQDTCCVTGADPCSLCLAAE
jgi:hypothetical protein